MPVLWLLTAIVAAVPVLIRAQAPTWWATRGVITPNATADDYAAINQGQVRNIAKQAYEELKARSLIDPVADAATPLVQIWENPALSTDDYAAINLGQLKYLAKPFYDRLIEIGYTDEYPWSGAADDYALANIGQAKFLFRFDLSVAHGDSDSDGLPDYWERYFLGDLRYTGADDPDGDHLSNDEEYFNGTNPMNRDTDGDRMSDKYEVYYHLEPLSAALHSSQNLGPSDDKDGDGKTNLEEFDAGTIPDHWADQWAIFQEGGITKVRWLALNPHIYTVQYTSNLFGTWTTSRFIRGDDDVVVIPISEIHSGPPPIFFRLQITDYSSDPDGLPDNWELYYFGDLTHNGTEHPTADGITNLEKFQLGLNPTINEVATNASIFSYDAIGRLTAVSGNSSARTFTYDNEGNITQTQ